MSQPSNQAASNAPFRMLFHGPGKPFETERLERPEALEANEVLVRLTAATICGSDCHTYVGRRSGPRPGVLGHEGVGIIEAVGSARRDLSVGTRVTWSLTDSCGECPACQDWGLPQKCDALFKYGHAPLNDHHGLNGCFASHIVLGSGTTVIPLPSNLSDTLAAPINCALATMVAVLEHLPTTAKSVLVQGAGLLGIYGCALLRQRGISQILLADPEQNRLQSAQAFGATEVLTDTRALPDASIDAAIEVAGHPSAVTEGIRLLRPGGVYVIAGLVHPDSALELTGEQLIRKALTLQGVHNYRPDHLQQAVSFMAATADTYDWQQLVSPPMPLSQLDKAFETALSRRWHRVAVSPQSPA